MLQFHSMFKMIRYRRVAHALVALAKIGGLLLFCPNRNGVSYNNYHPCSSQDINDTAYTFTQALRSKSLLPSPNQSDGCWMVKMANQEVITLSSSPLRSTENRPATFSEQPSKPSFSNAHIDWDDFLSSAEKPAKRRKLSPLPQDVRSQPLHNVDVEAIFELSSEPDVALPVRKTKVSNATQDTNVTIHNLDDSENGMPSFSSPTLLPSRPATMIGQVKVNRNTIELLSDDVVDLSDPIGSPVRPPRNPNLNLSAGAAALLEKVNKKAKKPSQSSRPVSSYAKATKYLQSSRSSMEVIDNIVDSSQTLLRKKKSTSVKDNATGKAPALQKKTSAEKEAEKEQKRLEKERKAAEKQRASDIAEVNQRKTDKAKAVHEMIIDLPNTLKGKSLGNKVEEEIKSFGAEHCYYADEVDLSQVGDARRLGNIIKWRRKVPSTYNEVLEEWVPVESKKVECEKHVLVHLPAEDFCLIAAVDPANSADTTSQIPTEEQMMDNLDVYMTVLRSRFPRYTIVILIEGLAQWLKKNTNAKNREYAAVVRGQAETTNDAQTKKASRKRKNQDAVDLTFISNDVVENLMLHLQLVHRPLYIHHTTTSECYRQIVAFTQHLSTRPYRNVELDRNLAHASFCMASGQFRTGGGDPADTWIKMLEQLNRLTIPYAKGIWDAGYESPAQLVKGFKKVKKGVTGGGQSLRGETSLERQAREKAKLMLQDVRRSNSDKRIGPQVSKRLYKVFMSRDEDLRDGIA